ncbi:MAG: hypothetical protein R2685_15275 [Candidatus Nitrosocosmicus sp.]|nr:hypothetical protein [Candidatus Nitrosocosmicus sp.]
MSINDVDLVDIGYSNNRQKYEIWCKNWWQWLLSIPKSKNPALDCDGNYAQIGQDDPHVFYLCQTLESSESIPERKITVPRGKKLFLPLINWISFKDKDTTNEAMKTIAQEKMDVIGNLNLNINKKQIIADFVKFRVKTPFFNVNLPQNNILNLDCDQILCLSDGYWICLKPNVENLQLTSFGSCSLGITEIGINYYIQIS